MSVLLLLLASYGICFGIQNKIPFLHEKHKKLDEFLRCPYCVGFHTGWIIYLLSTDNVVALELLVWSFSSSAFCYIIDISAQYIESRTS